MDFCNFYKLIKTATNKRFAVMRGVCPQKVLSDFQAFAPRANICETPHYSKPPTVSGNVGSDKRAKMKIEKVKNNYPYELLLLADETVEAINSYLFDSNVYVAKIKEERIGAFCLLPHDEETIEIMNIAVSSEMQNKGIGSLLMCEIEKIARKEKYKTIIVGTGDCGLMQIHFYEKNGYSQYELKKNFFLEKFDEPVFENGIMLKDMVMLRKELE